MKLDRIAERLTRRAALHQSTLSPVRAEEWAAALRQAEAFLVQYAADLRQSRQRKSA